MFKPFHDSLSHVLFIVDDVKKSTAFYRDVLDFHVQMEEYNLPLSETYIKQGIKVHAIILERFDDVMGMIELCEWVPKLYKPQPERGFYDLGFWAAVMEVKNLDAIYKQWSGRGVTFEAKPNVQNIGSQGKLYSALIKDIDGNRLELIQRLD